MSRYPFEEYAEQFLDAVKDFYAPITWKGLYRRYRRINHDLIALQRVSDLSSTSPKRMSSEDIRIYLSWRRSLGYSNKEYAHEVNALTILFDYVGNPAVRQCMSRYPLIRPNGSDPRHGSISKSDRMKLIHSMDSYAESNDFTMVRSYAMVAFFIGAGLRSKELRLLEVDDFDTDSWILNIVHVKGEDSYGHARFVLIAPEFHPIIGNYLRLRSDNVTGSSAMFAPMIHNETGYLSSNSVLRIVSICEKDCGVRCDTRMFRRSFGQDLLDRDIDSIESVSVLMGHSSTRTTERYYARRKNDSAIAAARAVYSGSGKDGCGCADSNAPDDDAHRNDSQTSSIGEEECRRPDSNRRTPTRRDLESLAFDQAWQLRHMRGLEGISREGGDLSPLTVYVEGVLVLRHHPAAGLDQRGVSGQDAVAHQVPDVLLGIGELAAPRTERELVELLLHIVQELLGLRVRHGLVPCQTDDVPEFPIDDITLSVCREGFDCNGHARFDDLLVAGIVAGDGHPRVKVVLLDLMTAEILDGNETVAIDAHLNGPADLPEGHSVSDELGDGVPGSLGGLHELGVPLGTDLDRSSRISDESVELRSAIDLDDISELEDGLVVTGRGVMGRDLVPADVAGECESASVLADVSLDLLSDIVQLDALGHEGQSQLSRLAGYASGLAELLQILGTQHPKTSLILSAGMAP